MMEVETYGGMFSAQISRRGMLKGAASVGALAALSCGTPGARMCPAHARTNLRADIL